MAFGGEHLIKLIMSYKFINAKREYINKINPEEMYSIAVYPADFKPNTSYHFLAIEVGNHLAEGYHKRLVEASLNIFAEAAQSLSKSKKSFDSKLSKDDINLEMVDMLTSFSRIAGYIVNSTSWREQELKDFDIFEISNRIEILKQHIR